MKTKASQIAALALLLNATPFPAAAVFTVPWHTVAGGGGQSTSVNGKWSVSGTAGKPDAGGLTGEKTALIGGFWYPQVACDCHLSISKFGDQIVVSWPAQWSGCTLETTTDLSPRNRVVEWKPLTAVLVGNKYIYTSTVQTENHFYRLNGI